jgi:hypothetical protein
MTGRIYSGNRYTPPKKFFRFKFLAASTTALPDPLLAITRQPRTDLLGPGSRHIQPTGHWHQRTSNGAALRDCSSAACAIPVSIRRSSRQTPGRTIYANTTQQRAVTSLMMASTLSVMFSAWMASILVNVGPKFTIGVSIDTMRCLKSTNRKRGSAKLGEVRSENFMQSLSTL